MKIITMLLLILSVLVLTSPPVMAGSGEDDALRGCEEWARKAEAPDLSLHLDRPGGFAGLEGWLDVWVKAVEAQDGKLDVAKLVGTGGFAVRGTRDWRVVISSMRRAVQDWSRDDFHRFFAAYGYLRVMNLLDKGGETGKNPENFVLGEALKEIGRTKMNHYSFISYLTSVYTSPLFGQIGGAPAHVRGFWTAAFTEGPGAINAELRQIEGFDGFDEFVAGYCAERMK